jgi:hypothetical protein
LVPLKWLTNLWETLQWLHCTRMRVRETECESVDCGQLAHDRDHQLGFRREEQRLRVFENRVLREICDSEMNQIRGQ